MKSSLRAASIFITGVAFVGFAMVGPGCQPTGGDQVGGDGGSNGGGNGGTTTSPQSTGGNPGSTGGNPSNTGGHTSSTGGTTSSTGGTTSGTGGTTARGGNTGSGGSSARGGTTSSSGGTTTSSGGTTTGSGGTTTSTGGVTTTGGTTTPTGGTTTSGTKNSGTTVTFDKGKAAGAMTGYGWVALGSLDTITDPTCGASKTPITSAAPCASDPNWSGTGLCITGSCPALDATTPDYTNNYGVVVGVNAGDAGGTGDSSMVLGQTFTSITINATGVPSSEVRAQIHIKGDADSKSYCLKFTPGTAMDIAKFATDCYNTAPSGLFPAASAPNIDKVSLEAVSASTAVTVTSMCMTGITFK
jgi:hypothetical protein